MRFCIGAILAVTLVSAPARADDKAAKAVIDKAIKALGGAGKLGAYKAATWKTKGKIYFGENENEFTSTATVKGLDHFRNEFEGNFGGNQLKGITVVSGDKGWRKFGDMKNEMDADAVANEKRQVYLQLAPALLSPLQSKGFTAKMAPEEKIGDKPAAVIKATGPDNKEFTIYFDKESGLPVKLVANVIGFMGDEFTQETTYASYKEMGGFKKATKVESKRDGQKFIETEITEFKLLDKVDDKTFTEPE